MKAPKIPIPKIKKTLEDIFEKHDHQKDVLMDIYQLFIPDWHQIERLKSHPSCGHELWKYICQLFVTFDRKFHPHCMAGGLWIDMGFSTDSTLNPWEVNLSQVTVIYKEVHHVEHTNRRTPEQNPKAL